MDRYHVRVDLEVTQEGDTLIRAARGLDGSEPLLEAVRDEVHEVLTAHGTETGFWRRARIS